jgi:hypothetical protein
MILTRGPFPTGEPWDEEVETHLETCSDCWRLADALRPALEVFQEAVPPAESRDLPGYWGDARPAANVVADLAGAAAYTATAYQRPRSTSSATRHAVERYRSHDRYPLTIRFSPDVLRAAVFTSTFIATALGLGILWWVW